MVPWLKIGDLIQDVEYGDIALVMKIDRKKGTAKYPTPYQVLPINKDISKGLIWLDTDYIDSCCEVIE
jgi:hypothetical protein